MSLRAWVALAVAVVYALLAAIHVYWACGGAWGSQGVIPHVGGRPTFAPTRLATIAVALALAAAALLVLSHAGWVPGLLPQATLRWGMYVLGTLFALRAIGDFRVAGFFKRTRDTHFARLDTWFFSPLCTLLAAAVMWLA